MNWIVRMVFLVVRWWFTTQCVGLVMDRILLCSSVTKYVLHLCQSFWCWFWVKSHICGRVLKIEDPVYLWVIGYGVDQENFIHCWTHKKARLDPIKFLIHSLIKSRQLRKCMFGTFLGHTFGKSQLVADLIQHTLNIVKLWIQSLTWSKIYSHDSQAQN